MLEPAPNNRVILYRMVIFLSADQRFDVRCPCAGLLLNESPTVPRRWGFQLLEGKKIGLP